MDPNIYYTTVIIYGVDANTDFNITFQTSHFNTKYHGQLLLCRVTQLTASDSEQHTT